MYSHIPFRTPNLTASPDLSAFNQITFLETQTLSGDEHADRSFWVKKPGLV